MKRCVIKQQVKLKQENNNIFLVPTITNQARAYQVLAKVKKELTVLHKKRNWAHMQKDTPLEIVEVDEISWE